MHVCKAVDSNLQCGAVNAAPKYQHRVRAHLASLMHPA
jgi:hypothetical protein